MMGIRLIFLNYITRVMSEEVTQKSKPAPDWMWGFKVVGRFSRQIRRAVNPESRARACRKAGEVAQFRCQENPRRQFVVYPYRKPTQVGKENILRRASELSLRN
jgi:hypothetical protein